MRPASRSFKSAARRALVDEELQSALERLAARNPPRVRRAKEQVPNFDVLRDRGVAVKDHTLRHLDFYAEEFAAKATTSGIEVHWAETAESARNSVLEILREVEAKSVTKGKSMISEELGLNGFLAANGIEAVETDVGEHIIQLAAEPPSHILAPALHKTRMEVADLYEEHHPGFQRPVDITPDSLVAETRRFLRPKFFQADAIITGANFLIADTGSVVIVSNEGNIDLGRCYAKTHIVVASLEKLLPKAMDAALLLRLLGRSATGQPLTVYTTIVSGPRGEHEADGSESVHVVLYDGGRTELVGTEFQSVLRCIRCGACMNHCPVYHAAGGHAYGWVYPGPIGAALNPALIGIKESFDLPRASSLCGRCEEVCPARIPLPRLLVQWREKQFGTGTASLLERFLARSYAWIAARPRLYGLMTRFGVRCMRMIARRRWAGRLLQRWSRGRCLPVPEGRTFREVWGARSGDA